MRSCQTPRMLAGRGAEAKGGRAGQEHAGLVTQGGANNTVLNADGFSAAGRRAAGVLLSSRLLLPPKHSCPRCQCHRSLCVPCYKAALLGRLSVAGSERVIRNLRFPFYSISRGVKDGSSSCQESAFPHQELGNSGDQSHSAGLAGAQGAGGVLTCFENLWVPSVLVFTSAGPFHPHNPRR